MRCMLRRPCGPRGTRRTRRCVAGAGRQAGAGQPAAAGTGAGRSLGRCPSTSITRPPRPCAPRPRRRSPRSWPATWATRRGATGRRRRRGGCSTTPATPWPSCSGARRARWSSRRVAPRPTTWRWSASPRRGRVASSARSTEHHAVLEPAVARGGHRGRRAARRRRSTSTRSPTALDDDRHARVGDARQQRDGVVHALDRVAAVVRRARAARVAAHRRRAGLRRGSTSPRWPAARRPRLGQRPQVRRARRASACSWCATGVDSSRPAARRRSGARAAQRHAERGRHRGHGRGRAVGGRRAQGHRSTASAPLRDRLVAGLRRGACPACTSRPPRRPARRRPVAQGRRHRAPVLRRRRERGAAVPARRGRRRRARRRRRAPAARMEPSHVLAAMGVDRELAVGSLRLSLGLVDGRRRRRPRARRRARRGRRACRSFAASAAAARVLVAMSGGVDSSVAAALLRDAGHEVVGVTMKLWGGDSDTGCCSVSDVDDARRRGRSSSASTTTCSTSATTSTSTSSPPTSPPTPPGLTPNPCIECNRHLKFDRLLRRADALGFDARRHRAPRPRRARGPTARAAWPAAPTRPRTSRYVLHMLDQHALARVAVAGRHHDQGRGAARSPRAWACARPTSPTARTCASSPPPAAARRSSATASRFTPGRVVDTAGARGGQRSTAVELVTIGQRRGLGPGRRRRAAGTRSSVDRAAATVTVGSRGRPAHLRPPSWARSSGRRLPVTGRVHGAVQRPRRARGGGARSPAPTAR